ncbi:MAG: hypothetical protein RKE49_08660 [Oceanicaulis sp.]
MLRLYAAAAVAAAMTAAPGFAQDAEPRYDEDQLIPLYLVSEDELLGADVYWSDGDNAGNVVSYETDDGDVTTLLVHELVPEKSVISRYRITGEDVFGYLEEEKTIVLGLDEYGYRDAY